MFKNTYKHNSKKQEQIEVSGSIAYREGNTSTEHYPGDSTECVVSFFKLTMDIWVFIILACFDVLYIQ